MIAIRELQSRKATRSQIQEIILDLVALASFDRHSENVVIEAVIIAELKFGNIEIKVLFANVVEGADDAVLEDAPESFNRIGVNRADNILPMGVIDSDVRD